MTVAFWDSKDKAVDIVPLVKYVIANGNTTTFQWRTNKVPSRVEEPSLDYLTGEDEDEKETEAEEVELCTTCTHKHTHSYTRIHLITYTHTHAATHPYTTHIFTDIIP